MTTKHTPGDLVIWRGITATVQATQETPQGLCVYCALTIGGILRAYWLDASDLAPIAKATGEAAQ